MAYLLLRPLLFRPQPQIHTPFLSLGLGLTVGLSLFAHHRFQTPARLDSGFASGGRNSAFSTESYTANTKTPVLGRSGVLNPGAVRQISSGSVIGLCAGILVSTFSRPLALLLGLAVVGVQWASSYGINLIPYQRLQKYTASIDVRSTVQDNIAFKLSFGMTFALAAFMHF